MSMFDLPLRKYKTPTRLFHQNPLDAVDCEYITQNLNLVDPYILKQTGLTQNFRSWGPNEQIVMQKRNEEGPYSRQFVADGGKGFADLMRLLFPSPSGELNIFLNSHKFPSFEGDCQTTPKLVAKIVAFVYRYRNMTAAEKATILDEINDILALFHTISENHKSDKSFNTYLHGLDIYLNYNSFYTDISTSFNTLLQKVNNTTNTEFQSKTALPPLDKELFDKIKAGTYGENYANDITGCLFPFILLNQKLTNREGYVTEKTSEKFNLKAYNNLRMFFDNQNKKKDAINLLKRTRLFFRKHLFDEFSFTYDRKLNVLDFKRTNTILLLLNSAIQAINDQEYDNEYDPENSPEKFVPKYTVEKMLMGYFIEKFSSEEDIDSFYKTTIDLIKLPSTGSPKEIKARQKKAKIAAEAAEKTLTNTISLLKQMNGSPLSPYKNVKPVTYSYACPIHRFPSQNGTASTVSFGNLQEGFLDCADNTMRHTLNLLGYSVIPNWGFFLNGMDETLKDKLKQFETNLVTNSPIDLLSFKERLQLFFYHQSQKEVGVNSGDSFTRTLWSYAISNMDQPADKEMQKIKYGKQGYELETGYVNSLKLIYNIARTLKSNHTGKLPSSEYSNFTKALESIQLLEDSIIKQNNSDLCDLLKNAIKKTYTLINPNIEVSSLNGLSTSTDDIFGSAEITLSDNPEFGNNSISFSHYQSALHAGISHDPLESTTKILASAPCLSESQTAKLICKKFLKDDWLEPSYLDTFYSLYGGFLKKKDFAGSLPQFYKTYRSLKFLRLAQSTESNHKLLERKLKNNPYIKDTPIVIKPSDSEHTQSFDHFLLENYINTKDSFQVFLDNPDFEPIHGKLPNFYQKYKTANRTFFADENYIYKINKSSHSASICGFINNSSSKDVTIPSSVKIGSETYWITEIYDEAFKSCSALTTVTFNSNSRITKIGNEAFSTCSGLITINLPPSILSIGDSAFETCSMLKAITIPETTTTIGNSSFAYCTNCKFTFPPNNHITQIGSAAFLGCNALEDITMLTNVQTIKSRAFEQCSALKYIFADNSLVSFIGNEAFKSCNALSEIILPSNISEIHPGTFHKCKTLKKVTIPANVKRIHSNAFSFCQHLNTLLFTADSSLSTIEDHAFDYCFELRRMHIPKNTRVGFSAHSFPITTYF